MGRTSTNRATGALPYAPLRRALVALVLAAAALVPRGASAATTADTADTAEGPAALVEVYVREGCPYCADAKAYLDQLARRRPGLRITLRPVDTDPAARAELEALSRQAGVWPPGVPAFAVAGHLLVGFDKRAAPAGSSRPCSTGGAPTPARSKAAGSARSARRGSACRCSRWPSACWTASTRVRCGCCCSCCRCWCGCRIAGAWR
jgi:glutaredoxin